MKQTRLYFLTLHHNLQQKVSGFITYDVSLDINAFESLIKFSNEEIFDIWYFALYGSIFGCIITLVIFPLDILFV